MRKTFKLSGLFSYSALVMMDAVLLFFADIFAFLSWIGTDFYHSKNFADYYRVFIFIIGLKLLCLYIFQLYTRPKYKSNFITAIYVLKATTFSLLITVLTTYFLRADSIPRLVLLLSWIYSALFIFSWRILAKSIIECFMGREFFKSQLLIIGTDSSAEKIAIRLLNDASINYSLVGFVEYSQSGANKLLLGRPVLGNLETLPEILKKYPIDDAVLASSTIDPKDLSKVFSFFKNRLETKFHISSDIYDGIISNATLCEKGVPFATVAPFHGFSVWYPPLKRICDVILSLLLLIITSPILIVTMVMIKLTSPGPVLYITKRVGYMGRLFVIYKFRSMYTRSSRAHIERWATKTDERVTPFGNIIRRFRVDELPQLIDVLKNDMSLIGPRPESRYYVNKLLKEIPLYSERFKVKPGITGWAQVNFGYAGSLEESKEKLLYDIYYIQNQSLALDILITLKTIKTIVLGVGAR